MASSNSTCYSGAEPTELHPHNLCNPGFFCRNSSVSQPPEFCPPTPACLITRFQAINNICLEPQGIYEPIICPPGFYCDLNGTHIAPCPQGHFCPLGTYEPFPCSHTSICPAGSEKEFVMAGFIVVLIFDLMILAFMLKHVKQFIRSIPQRFSHDFRFLAISSAEAGIKIEQGDLAAREAGASGQKDSSTSDDYITDKDTLSKFVASVKRCVACNEVGISFGFNAISLTLKNGKEILGSQFGHIEKGSLWGIMGASGAGKSSLVNVIMGKTKQTCGDIYVNQTLSNISRFKQLIGYVPQDDIIMPELTVRENLMHSARIRLPSKWTDAECSDHVDTLLSCLGLSHVQHNIVGDTISSAISGGQRKRVSIGIELAAAPMAVFLDEPTSGLDATAALSIMRLLKTISQLGVTIICIIHQPRLEILEVLNGIHLLASGRQIYHGEASGIAHYFDSMGFDVSKRSNAADAVLDIISDQSTVYNKSGRRVDSKGLAEHWRSSTPIPAEILRISTTTPTPESRFQLEALLKSAAGRGAVWPTQVKLCFVRSIKQQWYRKTSYLLEVAVGAVSGLLIGLSLYQLRGRHFQGIYNEPFELLSSAVLYTLVPEIGLLCCLAIGLAASAPGVKTFGEEKQIYWREASAGHSRSAYYVGKVLATLPRLAISSMHFTSFYYILATPMMPFWNMYLTNLLYFYCVYGLASVTSMIVRREDGPLLAMIVSLITGVFNGYGPPLTNVQEWGLAWFWLLCPGVWFTEAYFDQHLEPYHYLYNLKAAEIWSGYTRERFHVDVILLFVIGTIYRIFAFIGLITFDRSKQL